MTLKNHLFRGLCKTVLLKITHPEHSGLNKIPGFAKPSIYLICPVYQGHFAFICILGLRKS